jgi:hypothetical protein
MLRGVGLLQLRANLVGKIHLPKACANLTFGGLPHNALYMCASTSGYVGIQGAQRPYPGHPRWGRRALGPFVLAQLKRSRAEPPSVRSPPQPRLPRDEATKLNN